MFSWLKLVARMIISTIMHTPDRMLFNPVVHHPIHVSHYVSPTSYPVKLLIMLPSLAPKGSKKLLYIIVPSSCSVKPLQLAVMSFRPLGHLVVRSSTRSAALTACCQSFSDSCRVHAGGMTEALCPSSTPAKGRPGRAH